MEWTNGYVADMEYVYGFYPELAPEQLALAAALRGHKPPALDEGFTYFEMGCGQGYSLNLLAASNPQGRFYGNDFNPTHVAGAQSLAAAAGLKNVTFLEKSFEELAAVDLPQFDFIALHGVYSWISAQNRKAIVDFIRTRLKAGGLAYISYNCLPGWSATAPVRRLMTEFARSSGGTLPQRMSNSLAFIDRLRGLQTGFFIPNPMLDSRLAQLQTASRNYLAHEYFNADWTPFYSADVTRDMSEAKLTFVGPASYVEHFEYLMVPEKALPVLAEIQEPTLHETVKDYLTNVAFRKDIYTRGRMALSVSELLSVVAKKRFMLALPRAEATLTARVPLGNVNLLPEVYNPVLDELAKGVCSLGDVVAALEPTGLAPDKVRQAVLVSLAVGHAVLVPSGFEAERKASTDRLNAVVVERALQGDLLQFMASPVLGTAVFVDWVDRLFLNTLPESQAEATAHAWEALQARNQVMMKDGKALATPAENLQELAVRHQLFINQRLPRYQQLGLA